jgi:hypothetical protein
LLSEFTVELVCGQTPFCAASQKTYRCTASAIVAGRPSVAKPVVDFSQIGPGGYDAQRVIVEPDGGAECCCVDSFKSGRCWHADLAPILVKKIGGAA